MTYRPAPYLVDILIRGWGNLDLTRRLIQSIYANTPPGKFRITYVDNGSEIMHLSDLMADYPDVTWLRLPFNHGSVRAINLGLHVALLSDAPYILLLDNDTAIPDGDTDWLPRLTGYMGATPDPSSLITSRVGAAGCVTDYASVLQNGERVPDRYVKDWTSGKERGTKAETTPPLLVSFAMMLSKAAVRAVGFFDEQFEPGNGEDFDYSIRLIEAGYLCVVADSVWIHHAGSQTFKRLGFANLLRQATEKLIAKHGEPKLKMLGINVRRA